MELCLYIKAVGTKIIAVLSYQQKAEQNLNINWKCNKLQCQIKIT
jgi:hypothetical protein